MPEKYVEEILRLLKRTEGNIKPRKEHDEMIQTLGLNPDRSPFDFLPKKKIFIKI